MQARLRLAVVSSLMTTLSSGCVQYQMEFHRILVDVDNRITSHVAWSNWKPDCDVQHEHHFGKGFRAAYRDVASGANGCQPVMPPNHYWGPGYHTATGNAKIHSWFNGYSQGAVAAFQNGANKYIGVPMSPQAKDNLEASVRRYEEFDWESVDWKIPAEMEECDDPPAPTDAPEKPPLPILKPFETCPPPCRTPVPLEDCHEANPHRQVSFETIRKPNSSGDAEDRKTPATTDNRPAMH